VVVPLATCTESLSYADVPLYLVSTRSRDDKVVLVAAGMATDCNSVSVWVVP